MAFAFIIYLALDLVYSLVNIPYGSLNASLTRDPESIDKLTSTRMMLANSANLLVYTLFPMFVQMAAPKDRSLKDTGFFGLKLNLGNYTDPSANYAWFGVYAIYMIIGAVACLSVINSPKNALSRPPSRPPTSKLLTFSTSSDITARW